jgi:hypothetical protein
VSATGFGRTVDVVALAVGFGALMLIVGSLLGGCGTWRDTARHTLATAASAVDVADQAQAAALETQCGHTAGDPAAVDACLAAHGYDDGARAIRSADATLRASQAFLDGAEHIADDVAQTQWLAMLPCVAATAVQAVDAVAAALGDASWGEAVTVMLRPTAAACAPPEVE